MNKFIFLLSFGALVACKSTKIVESEPPKITSKDYPYVETFHKGVRFKIQGRLVEAQAEFEKCLSIRKDDDAVYYALSQIRLMQDDFILSAEYIQKAAEIDPTNTWYVQELAYMFFEMGDYQNSVYNFKKLVDIEPRNIDWMYGYAEALVQNKEPSKAIEALNRTEDQVGTYPELSIQKYELHMSLGNEADAINELEACKLKFPKSPQIIATLVDHYFRKNDYPKAISMLQELVEADPTNGRARLALADVYRQQGELDQALDQLEVAIPSSDVDIDSKMRILISLHDSPLATDPRVLGLVEKLVIAHQTDAKSHSIQADFLLKTGDEEGALKSYKNALIYDKSQYAIWNQVLIMQYQSGLFTDLYIDSKECLELFPTQPTSYLLFGVSANQLDKHDEALEALSAGKEMVINDPALMAEFYGQLGDAYFSLNNVNDGSKNYKKAIEIDSRSNLLKNNYAYHLANAKKDLELATSLIKQAIESSPLNPQYVDTYGWILFQQGAYKEALGKFVAADEIMNDDKLTMEHIGDAYSMLGVKDKAIEWWKKALELSSDDEYLKKKISTKKYHERGH